MPGVRDGTRVTIAIALDFAPTARPRGPSFAADEDTAESHERDGARGSKPMNLLLILIILLVLLGGGGFYAGGPRVGGGAVGLILLIIVILALMGRL